MEFTAMQGELGSITLRASYKIDVEKKIQSKFPEAKYFNVLLGITLPKIIAESSGKIGALIALQNKHKEPISCLLIIQDEQGKNLDQISCSASSFFQVAQQSNIPIRYFTREGWVQVLKNYGVLLQYHFSTNKNYLPVNMLSTYWLSVCTGTNFDGYALVHTTLGEDSLDDIVAQNIVLDERTSKVNKVQEF